MTERSTDQKPMDYSELRRHASKLEQEVERLRAYKRNARSQLKQLNAKVASLVKLARARAAGVPLDAVCMDEVLACNIRLTKRALAAEQSNALLSARLGAAAVGVTQVGPVTVYEFPEVVASESCEDCSSTAEPSEPGVVGPVLCLGCIEKREATIFGERPTVTPPIAASYAEYEASARSDDPEDYHG